MNTGGARRGRLVGIDAARGLAIVTMFIAHLAPIKLDSPLLVRGLVVADAVTAPLFAVLVGVSLGLMSGGTDPRDRGQGRGMLAVQMLVRAALITVIGYLLVLAGAQVAIVLQYLGVAMAVLVALLYLRPWIMIAVAAGIIVMSPVVVSLARDLVITGGLPFIRPGFPVTGELFHLLFTSPYYQVFAFVGYGLVGLAAVRFGLNRSRTTLPLIIVGTVLVITAYALARPVGITAEAYAPTILSYVAATGWASAILGVFAWVTLSAPDALRRTARTVLGPLADVGTMTLTVYSLQIIVLGIWARLNPGQSDDSWLMLVALLVVAFAFAMAWTRYVGRGPLEALIAVLSGRTGPRRARTAAGALS